MQMGMTRSTNSHFILNTRVNALNNDDYKKLCRTVQYLCATKGLPLTLEADQTNVVKWWVDASHAVH